MIKVLFGQHEEPFEVYTDVIPGDVLRESVLAGQPFLVMAKIYDINPPHYMILLKEGSTSIKTRGLDDIVISTERRDRDRPKKLGDCGIFLLTWDGIVFEVEDAWKV